MKNVVKAFGAIVFALVIVIVWSLVQKNKVQSEVRTATDQLIDITNEYSFIVDTLGGTTWVNNVKLLEEARVRLQDTKIDIELLEEQKAKVEEEIGKKWGEYNHYLEAAGIIKQDIKDSMWLN